LGKYNNSGSDAGMAAQGPLREILRGRELRLFVSPTGGVCICLHQRVWFPIDKFKLVVNPIENILLFCKLLNCPGLNKFLHSTTIYDGILASSGDTLPCNVSVTYLMSESSLLNMKL